MTTALILLALWFILSIPFGMFIGKCIGYCSCEERRR
jgi:hypothetical protein